AQVPHPIESVIEQQGVGVRGVEEGGFGIGADRSVRVDQSIDFDSLREVRECDGTAAALWFEMIAWRISFRVRRSSRGVHWPCPDWPRLDRAQSRSQNDVRCVQTPSISVLGHRDFQRYPG